MSEGTAAAADEVWRQFGEHLGQKPDMLDTYVFEARGLQLLVYRADRKDLTAVSVRKKLEGLLPLGDPIMRRGLVGVDISVPGKATLLFRTIQGYLESIEIVAAAANYVLYGAVKA